MKSVLKPMFSEPYRRYALFSMTFLYGLNAADRSVLMMTLQPIKQEFGLSDTQLGLLTGMFSGLLLSVVGVLIARWADRGNRVSIASLAIAFWGIVVMATVFVTNYVQLLIARVAASIGESGGGPPTYSLLADYFPEPRERTRAMYVYQLSGPVASMIVLGAAGWLTARYGWRMAFFLVGLPGLACAALFKRTIREPRVRAAENGNPSPSPSLATVLRTLWRLRSCRRLIIAMILSGTMLQGLTPWYAAFLLRSHDIGTSELGIWMGMAFGLGGIASLILGRFVIDRWFYGDEQSQIRVAAVALAFSTAFVVAFLSLPNERAAVMALIPQSILLVAFMPPVLVSLQRLMSDEMRATAMSLMTLVTNLVAAVVGPQLVGTISDLLAFSIGAESLRYSMLIVSMLGPLAAYHMWRSGDAIHDDLRTAASAAEYSQLGVVPTA